MKKNIESPSGRPQGRSLTGLLAKVGLSFAMGAAALSAPAAWAGWNSAQEAIATHPTWIYTPATTMPSGGKRALVVVLHGCDQSNTQLKEWGNLASTAEAKGAVIAVPGVGDKPWPLFASTKCWNYDGATDGSGHIVNLVNLTETLASRAGLNIDRNHVYVTGMSSGASVAMLAACKAPDLFAGVSAVAGPSIGSNQSSAIQDGGSIFHTPEQARDKCLALAGTAKRSYLDTQIANIGYGEMDKNAEKPGCSYSANSTSCPGTYQLVSKKWSTINTDMYRLVYGAGTLGAAETFTHGEHRQAGKDGKSRIALTRMYNVGHAWPAGSGEANSVAKGGVWMAQTGLNYASHMIDWMVENNLRDTGGPKMTSCSATVSGNNVTVKGAAVDEKRPIISYQVKLNGPSNVDDKNAGSGSSFSKTYAVANGGYTGTVTATNDLNQTSGSCVLNDVWVGPPPPLKPPVITQPVETTKYTVTLKWSAVQGADGYHVYRDGSKVTQNLLTTTSHTDTELKASTTYRYTVTAVRGTTETEHSASVEATTKDEWTCPPPITVSNYKHVQDGRAYASGGYAYAKGSNQRMGLYNLFYTTKLAEAKQAYFVIGECPKP